MEQLIEKLIYQNWHMKYNHVQSFHNAYLLWPTKQSLVLFVCISLFQNGLHEPVATPFLVMMLVLLS